MNEYLITITDTNYYTFTLEANSQEDAFDKASEVLWHGKHHDFGITGNEESVYSVEKLEEQVMSKENLSGLDKQEEAYFYHSIDAFCDLADVYGIEYMASKSNNLRLALIKWMTDTEEDS